MPVFVMEIRKRNKERECESRGRHSKGEKSGETKLSAAGLDLLDIQ